MRKASVILLVIIMLAWTVYCWVKIIPAYFAVLTISEMLSKTTDWSMASGNLENAGFGIGSFMRFMIWLWLWFLPYMGAGIMALIMKQPDRPLQFPAMMKESPISVKGFTEAPAE